MFDLLNGKEAIEAAITSIQTNGKKLDLDIHVAGVSCLNHINEHGDVTLLNRLVAAMPKGSRVNALRAWAEDFGRVSYNTDTNVFDFDKKSKPTDLVKAAETSWTEYKPESKYVPMDFRAKLTVLLNEAVKRSALDKGDKIDEDLLKDVAEATGLKLVTTVGLVADAPIPAAATAEEPIAMAQ